MKDNEFVRFAKCVCMCVKGRVDYCFLLFNLCIDLFVVQYLFIIRVKELFSSVFVCVCACVNNLFSYYVILCA